MRCTTPWKYIECDFASNIGVAPAHTNSVWLDGASATANVNNTWNEYQVFENTLISYFERWRFRRYIVMVTCQEQLSCDRLPEQYSTWVVVVACNCMEAWSPQTYHFLISMWHQPIFFVANTPEHWDARCKEMISLSCCGSCCSGTTGKTDNHKTDSSHYGCIGQPALLKCSVRYVCLCMNPQICCGYLEFCSPNGIASCGAIGHMCSNQ